MQFHPGCRYNFVEQLTTFMKRVFLTVFLGLLLSLPSFADGGSPYELNEAEVEGFFANAEEVSIQELLTMKEQGVSGNNLTFVKQSSEKSQKMAGVMAGTQLLALLWFLPIHRAYLGTSGYTIAGYVLTFGGCGVITLIDAIVLLSEPDEGQFVNNRQYFMWNFSS